jgi:hypothetical protein
MIDTFTDKPVPDRPQQGIVWQPDLLAMQRRQVALDMALRYFTGRTPETIVKSAAVFEAYLKGESA